MASKQANKQTSKQARIPDTHFRNAVMLVWGSLRLAPIMGELLLICVDICNIVVSAKTVCRYTTIHPVHYNMVSGAYSAIPPLQKYFV